MNSEIGKALHKHIGVKARAEYNAIKYVAIKEALQLLVTTGKCLVRTEAPLFPRNIQAMREHVFGSKEMGIDIYIHSQGGLIVWISPAKCFAYDSYKETSTS